jgi:hypothetical protein
MKALTISPSFFHPAAIALVGLAIGVGCSGASQPPARYRARRSTPGAAPQERASCPAGKSCSAEAAGNYLDCVQGTVLSLEKARKPVAAFDRAALALLDPTLDAAKSERDELFRIASRLAMPALDDLDELGANDRWDLAARKAAFACAPWYRAGRICPVDGEVARYVGGARRFHHTKANELRAQWPAAAALHACVAASADCPKELLAAADKWTILSKAEYSVSVAKSAPGCDDIVKAIELPGAKKLGAARTLAFELVVESCGPVDEKAAKEPVDGQCYYPPGTKKGEKLGRASPKRCRPRRSPSRRRSAPTRSARSRWWRTSRCRSPAGSDDAKSPPIVATIEQSSFRLESDRCEVDGAWGPAKIERELAKQISAPMPAWIEPQLAVRVEDHMARAKKEQSGGGLRRGRPLPRARCAPFDEERRRHERGARADRRVVRRSLWHPRRLPGRHERPRARRDLGGCGLQLARYPQGRNASRSGLRQVSSAKRRLHEPHRRTALDAHWLAPLPATAPRDHLEVETRSLFLTMRDGTRIAIDLHLPKLTGGVARLPTIVRMTRYLRSLAHKNRVAGWLDVAKNFDIYSDLRPRFLAAGYAWVDVDVRGTGASSGTWTSPWHADQVRDSGEIVDWIVKQPWSTGKVGSLGISYDGTAAEMLLVAKHPAVLAVAPLFSLYDVYADVAFPGGIHLAWFTEAWGRYNAALDRNAFHEAFATPIHLVARVAANDPSPRGADRLSAWLGRRDKQLFTDITERVLGVAIRGVRDVERPGDGTPTRARWPSGN